MKYDPWADPTFVRRLKNVLVAASRAENPEFKEMWLKKFDELFLLTE
jgi:hypothetical protein